MEKKVHPGYTEANRLAWNEAMPLHQVVRKEYWDEQFSTSGHVETVVLMSRVDK